VRRVILLGIGALIAGGVFGFVTMPPARPAASITLQSPAPATPVLAASAFLVGSAPTAAPSATSTTAPPTLAPTPTQVPATPTPAPPTATPTPAGPVKTGNAPAPAVNAWSIAVVDEESGALLYGRDPHRHLAPASLTKIFTALVALKNTQDLQKPITVQFDSTELVDSTLMGIKPGETYTMEDLLYGLMLPSGNDAALAIANQIAGSEDQFATMMNAEASALGLTDSHFVDAHGLDRPEHYSSAYDLALAAREGMLRSDEFRTLARAKAWQVHGTRSYWVGNLNRFLRSYDGADGVKIGYTDNSGPAIVASATRNGHRVLVALLHCGDIVGDSVPLFNWAFANFTWPAMPAPTATSTTASQP
jgi:D-alanyl-D-alanine carboxypeptidase